MRERERERERESDGIGEDLRSVVCVAFVKEDPCYIFYYELGLLSTDISHVKKKMNDVRFFK